jgi:hypothetical protein
VNDHQRIVLILGSAPDAVRARDWPRSQITDIVAVNNAWRIRPDWDWHIHPEDFPPENMPPRIGRTQRTITADDYVPRQNALGGFVYAGGTMAFTAGYWALHALRPRVIAWIGCDMIYAAEGQTHFYGNGTPDPLRNDISLRSLEAKSARLMLIAAQHGTACVNLSRGPSRLVFPRSTLDALVGTPPPVADGALIAAPLSVEKRLGYMVPSGRYWEETGRFDPGEIDQLEALWLDALATSRGHSSARRTGHAHQTDGAMSDTAPRTPGATEGRSGTTR